MKKLLAFAVAGTLVVTGSALARSTTLHIRAKTDNFAFSTKRLTARAGTVTIKMTNPSGTEHGIAIKRHGAGKIVGPGKTSSITAKLKPGKYTFYCPVPGHEALGMKGTLVVR